MHIRLAQKEDFKKIVDIYNQVIVEGGVIGYKQPFEYKDREAWFEGFFNGRYFLQVAEVDKEIVGWTCVVPYRQGRDLLDRACVVSYFFDKDHRRKGGGTLMLPLAVEEARKRGFKTMLAIVFEHNEGSIRLLEKEGFERWALLPGIAEFEGTVFNHVYYGIEL